MLTEFAVFQTTRGESENNRDEELSSQNPLTILSSLEEGMMIGGNMEKEEDDSNNATEQQEICSSRITRLYGQDCKFVQGCTSFFTLKPMGDEKI